MTIRGTHIVLLALAGSYCSTADGMSQSTVPPALPSSIQQKFLCEQSHTNFAWGYVHKGIYIDGQGGVYSFDARKRPDLSSQHANEITDETLETEYSQGRVRLRTVAPGELATMAARITEASRGRYSERIQRGADQGATVSSCFAYDTASKRYRAVELEVSGDWNYQNQSPAARQLAKWLASLANPVP